MGGNDGRKKPYARSHMADYSLVKSDDVDINPSHFRKRAGIDKISPKTKH